MSRSTQWLQKKKHELSTLEEEAESLCKVVCDGTGEIPQELMVLEDKICSALETEAKIITITKVDNYNY